MSQMTLNVVYQVLGTLHIMGSMNRGCPRPPKKLDYKPPHTDLRLGTVPYFSLVGNNLKHHLLRLKPNDYNDLRYIVHL